MNHNSPSRLEILKSDTKNMTRKYVWPLYLARVVRGKYGVPTYKCANRYQKNQLHIRQLTTMAATRLNCLVTCALLLHWSCCVYGQPTRHYQHSLETEDTSDLSMASPNQNLDYNEDAPSFKTKLFEKNNAMDNHRNLFVVKSPCSSKNKLCDKPEVFEFLLLGKDPIDVVNT